MSAVRFSIVIACYNQRDFIRSAVDSALSQSHPSKEIIVVDDGSSDGTPETLEEYGNSIQLVKFSRNSGAIKARNCGAARSTGEYLVFLDGDDLFTPWALEAYERIAAERSPKVMVAQRVWFKETVPDLENAPTPRHIEFVEFLSYMQRDRQFPMGASGLVIHRQVFEEIGGWSPGLFEADCMDIVSKLGYSRKTILVCAPAAVFFRLHSRNSSHAVGPFLRGIRQTLCRERAGEYSSCQKHQFDTHAWYGSLILDGIRKAVQAGLYKDAMRLAFSGRSMILAKILRLLVIYVTGQRPVEILQWCPGRTSAESIENQAVMRSAI